MGAVDRAPGWAIRELETAPAHEPAPTVAPELPTLAMFYAVIVPAVLLLVALIPLEVAS